MELDFNFQSEDFNIRYDVFFTKKNNHTIEKSMYALGVLLKSWHHSQRNIRPYNPKDYELIDHWDINKWMRVTWGADDIKNDDQSSADFDHAMNETPYFDFLISQAVKYDRPDWSMFGLLGMLQGTLNANRFPVDNTEHTLSISDFIRCLNYLKIDFIDKYASDLEYLFSYFDERGLKLKIKKESSTYCFEVIDS